MSKPDGVHAEQAKQILARSGRTFHLASLLLPAAMRQDAALLYAFCRRMDDIADEAASQGCGYLPGVAQWLQADPTSIAATEAGWPPEFESRYPGMSAIASELTRALSDDAGSRRMASLAELHRYAYGVAGTVGLMMRLILRAPAEGAEAARDLGIAMQFTNIARDVREDLNRDRVYLPADWVNCDELKRAAGGVSAPAGLESGVLLLLAHADRLYAAADQGMGYVPWRARVAILCAASCYREIGVRIRRNPSVSWRKRVVVSSARKAVLIARSFLRSFFYRSPHAVASSKSARIGQSIASNKGRL